MKQFAEVLQWIGALFIIAGHGLNALAIDGWNIAAFTAGTVFFLVWSAIVVNKPQITVNVVAITTCTVGLFRAFG